MAAIALVAPEIPQNIGSVIRTCACFDLALHIVGPLPFALDMHRLRRVTMDYIDLLKYQVHKDFAAFLSTIDPADLVATTPARSAVQYTAHTYTHKTIALFGSESRGLSQDVLSAAPGAVHIPMQPKARSLNLAVSVGIIGAHIHLVTTHH